MKRVVWFALGAAVAGVVVWKGAQLYRKSVPVAVQEKMAETSDDLGKRVRAFVSTFQQARDEREAELREALGITEAEAEQAVAAARPAAAPARRAMRV